MVSISAKDKVVEDIILRITFDGSFQRAKLYTQGVSDQRRKKFRNYLAAVLDSTLIQILSKREYNDEQHFETIESFAETISKKNKEILKDGKLRIGIAQKLINLHWKFSWLLKPNIRMPIHCPFDSIVIKKLGGSVSRLAWTQMDRISDYALLINEAKKLVGANDSIAEWELRTYWEVVNYVNTDLSTTN